MKVGERERGNEGGEVDSRAWVQRRGWEREERAGVVRRVEIGNHLLSVACAHVYNALRIVCFTFAMSMS